MTLALAMALFGLFLLIVAIALLNGQRRSRLQLRDLQEQAERMEGELRTPEESARLARRAEEIEARKRQLHGRFDGGGW